MAQTLFKILKAKDRNAIIDVMAPSWSSALLDRMPEVRKGYVMSIAHGKFDLKERRRLGQSIRAEGYSQAFVLPNSWKSALIPWFAKIPKRTGYMRELRFGLINDFHILNKQRLPRMIDRFAALGFEQGATLPQPLPYPRLEIRPESVEKAKAKFSLLAHRPVLALCPGAEFGASKRWPEHHYAAVAREKILEGWEVWLFGSKNDMPVSAAIQNELQHQCVDLTGKTNLEEAIDLLSLASAVIANDSGLMHIAAALDKPLVAIYGSTDPKFAPPLGTRSESVSLNLPCSPCRQRECPLVHHNCMQKLGPDNILTALNIVHKAG